jgi:molybdopterin/thiamine biosynthesis adenylyltransferase
MSIDLGTSEARYDRQELITWWDQSRLTTARVLVVGAGALGNELVKNLALLGVGNIDVIDLDVVARSNLSRCVFFREADEGCEKAEVVADRASEVNPEVVIRGIVGDVRRIGLAHLRRYDLVLGGLDNREARVWINASCRKLGMTWIDGAIEGLQGVVKVFPPKGPCYECTLGETDRQILAHRKSCTLLSEEAMLEGKVPTTATTSSIIAGLQVQEAVKILVGREDLVALDGAGLVIVGDTLDTFRVAYTADEWCPAHDTYDALVDVAIDPHTTLRDVAAVCEPSEDAVVDLEGDLVRTTTCPACHQETPIGRMLLALTTADGTCKCGEVLQLLTATAIPLNDSLTERRLDELGLVGGDVITIRDGNQRSHLALGTAPR